MKRSMRHIISMAVCLSSGLALTTACSQEEGKHLFSSQEISVFTSVSRSDKAESGKGEEVKACLLFWRENDYHQMLKDNFSKDPFLVSEPEEKIDYYNVTSGVPYDTQQSYPLGDRLLHVCGFAPASLQPRNHYRTLDIPQELQNGKTDFLSGDGNRYRVGRSTDPFIKEVNENEDYVAKNKSKQLEFCHLTSKIVVIAKRSDNMLGRIGVRNIRATLYGQKVPTQLEWRQLSKKGDTDEKYNWMGYLPIVSTSSQKNILLASQSNDPLIQNMEQRVDSCYVLAGNEEHFHPSQGEPIETNESISMQMDVEAELIPVVNGAYDYNQAKTEKWNRVNVDIDSKTGEKLKMGYKYEIKITFDITGIRLQGIEMEWEEGGTHYIPITPKPDKDKKEENQA